MDAMPLCVSVSVDALIQRMTTALKSSPGKLSHLRSELINPHYIKRQPSLNLNFRNR